MDVQSPDLLSMADDDIPAPPDMTADEKVFAEYYDREVRATAVTLEADLASAKVESSRRSKVGWLYFIPFCAAMLWIGHLGIPGIAFIGILSGAAIFVGYSSKPLGDFKARRDDTVIPRIVAFFPGFKYQRDAPPDSYTLYKAAIIPTGTRQYNGDMVIGKHQETEVRISEVMTEETTGSGKNRRTRTIFRGLFFTVEFEKPFTGVTLVEREGGSFYSVLPTVLKDRSLDPVSLEDPDFEREFRVRSTDQVEARYLLTPDFMVRLHDLSAQSVAKGLRCAFVDNTFFLAIPTDYDYFELGGADSQKSNLEQAMQVYRDIRDLLAVLDALKINAGRTVRTDQPEWIPKP